jgi:hypothetical protein
LEIKNNIKLLKNGEHGEQGEHGESQAKKSG